MDMGMNTYKIDKEKLIRKINEAGLKQSYIATRLRVSEKTISRWVTGKVLFIKYHNLKALSQLFDCKDEELLVPKQDRLVDYLLEGELLDKLSPYGDYQMVEKIFSTILSDDMDLQTKAEVYLVLANTSWRRKEYEEGLRYANLVFDIAESTGNRQLKFEALFHIGTIYSIIGNHQAMEYLLKSYELKDHCKQLKKLAGLCNNISMTYREMGELEKSISFMDEAYGYYKMEDRYFNLCICCQGYMSIYNELGLPNKALTYGEEAKTYSRKAYYDEGYEGVLMYELDALSQIGRSLDKEHITMLEKVINGEAKDYYGLEGVMQYISRTEPGKLDTIYSLYENEVPAIVKGIMMKIMGRNSEADQIFQGLGYDKRLSITD